MLAFRSGSQNTAIGYQTLGGTANSNSTGSWNTALGTQALTRLATGSFNIAIGNKAGQFVTSSNSGLFINGMDQTTEAQAYSSSIIYGLMAGATAPETQVLRFNAQVNLPYGATGSLLGTASVAISASAADTITFTPQTASYAVTSSAATSITFTPATASYALTSSYLNAGTLNGPIAITGSVAGEVIAMSISSNTASFNASAGSFYTLTLVSGSRTFVSASSIVPGRTMTLRVKQASVASGSIAFASAFKFPTASAYTATGTADAEDIISFITFDGTSIYAVSSKQMV